jgi:hypothetical protein
MIHSAEKGYRHQTSSFGFQEKYLMPVASSHLRFTLSANRFNLKPDLLVMSGLSRSFGDGRFVRIGISGSVAV